MKSTISNLWSIRYTFPKYCLRFLYAPCLAFRSWRYSRLTALVEIFKPQSKKPPKQTTQFDEAEADLRDLQWLDRWSTIEDTDALKAATMLGSAGPIKTLQVTGNALSRDAFSAVLSAELSRRIHSSRVLDKFPKQFIQLVFNQVVKQFVDFISDQIVTRVIKRDELDVCFVAAKGHFAAALAAEKIAARTEKLLLLALYDAKRAFEAAVTSSSDAASASVAIDAALEKAQDCCTELIMSHWPENVHSKELTAFGLMHFGEATPEFSQLHWYHTAFTAPHTPFTALHPTIPALNDLQWADGQIKYLLEGFMFVDDSLDYMEKTGLSYLFLRRLPLFIHFIQGYLNGSKLRRSRQLMMDPHLVSRDVQRNAVSSTQQNLSTSAIFLSSVTATTIQYTLGQLPSLPTSPPLSHTLTAVSLFWYLSLVLSTGSAIGC